MTQQSFLCPRWFAVWSVIGDSTCKSHSTTTSLAIRVARGYLTPTGKSERELCCCRNLEQPRQPKMRTFRISPGEQPGVRQYVFYNTFWWPCLRLNVLFDMLLWVDLSVIYMKIYMLQTKFSVSFARRDKDEAMTVLVAVGLHITDLIFQAINWSIEENYKVSWLLAPRYSNRLQVRCYLIC